MYRASEDGRFFYVNTAFARMLGYTVEELMARNLNREVYAIPGAREALIRTYKPLGQTDGTEVLLRRKDGATLTVQIWGHVVETPEGTRYDAWVIDVTALRAANEELERAASILDLVVRQMPAIYWVVDRELRVLRTGGAIETVLGYDRARFLGRTLHEAQREEPSSIDPIAVHRRALAGEIVRNVGLHGTAVEGLDPERAFAEARLATIRPGEMLVARGTPPAFVYVPVAGGLVVRPGGGYAPSPLAPWVPVGTTGVIRRAERNSDIVAEREVAVVMIPAERYAAVWLRPLRPEQLRERLAVRLVPG
jgi:PAS domain S-box-containing protein